MVRHLLLAAIAGSAAASPHFLDTKLVSIVKKAVQEVHSAAVKASREPEAQQKQPVFPQSWGPEPEVGTADHVPLAGGYGHGSSTLSAWIQANIDRDRALGRVQYPPAFGEKPL